MKKKVNRLFQEKNTIKLILIPSIILLIIPVILFLWNRVFFDFEEPIDETLLGTLGDFIGGVFGSIWALIGVILFYLALREQRNDIATNKLALNKQIEALEVQTKEFGLQKDELIESRKVFTEQSKTLKKQQFETTFFSLLNMYSENIKTLNSKHYSSGTDYFVEFIKKLSNNCNTDPSPIVNHINTLDNYSNLYFEYRDDIAHYFKIVYQIVKFIDTSSVENKFVYAKIFRAQFSEKELLILYYNSHTGYATKPCTIS